jgi:uncharacterized protein (TIGR00251 family)
VEAVREVANGVQLLVRAQPGAKRTEVVGVLDGQIRIRLAAPAVDGKANVELIRFLARTLRIRRADVSIRRGATSRIKVVGIVGVGVESCRSAFGAPPP